MGDPLSISASIIALATAGLGSTKFIYETVSSLCKSQEEFARAGQALENLISILRQIQVLAGRLSLSSSLPSTNGDAASSPSNGGSPFNDLQAAVTRCLDDLNHFVQKVEKWKAIAVEEHKIKLALKWHIRASDLREIHVVVSRQIQVLNIQLGIAGCNQITQQGESNKTSESKLNSRLNDLSSKVQDCTTIVTSQISTSRRQIEDASDRTKDGVIASVNSVGRKSTLHHDNIQGSIKTLEQSISTGFTDQSSMLQEMMRQIQQQIISIKKIENGDELRELLQKCVDRLHNLKDIENEDLDIDSSEAQQIAEDIVTIMKILLKEISFPDLSQSNNKRKRDIIAYEVSDDEAATKQRRAIKKMRGILDSSEAMQVRALNWQKDRVLDGRRLESHSKTYNSSAGTLAITAITRAYDNSSTQLHYYNEPVRQTFAGTITLMPKTRHKKMKIRASFYQHMMRNGAFSFAPTISYHAVIPDDSLVFKVIDEGDLEGLKDILQKGLASITDCDTKGGSLLSNSLCSDSGHCHPHICEYLVSKNVDVDSFESSSWKTSIIPVMNHFIWRDEASEKAKVHQCLRLLLAAGADPSLHNEQADEDTEICALQAAVTNMDLDRLLIILHDGGPLVDLANCDSSGETALLHAIRSMSSPPSSGSVHYVEESFRIANILLDHKASCEAINRWGATCLHLIFIREWLFNHSVMILRPCSPLTRILTRLIQARANVSAVDNHGFSVSHTAKRGGYERSWRRALSDCGYSPEEVYAKSGVEWEDLENDCIEQDIVEILSHIGTESLRAKSYDRNITTIPRQWSYETLQKLMAEAMTAGANFCKPVGPLAKSLPYLAGYYHADREFREALKICGFDPKDVYAEAGVAYVELEDITFDHGHEIEEIEYETEDEDGIEEDEDVNKFEGIYEDTMNYNLAILDEAQAMKQMEVVEEESPEGTTHMDLSGNTQYPITHQVSSLDQDTASFRTNFKHNFNRAPTFEDHPQDIMQSSWGLQDSAGIWSVEEDNNGQAQQQPSYGGVDFTHEMDIWKEE